MAREAGADISESVASAGTERSDRREGVTRAPLSNSGILKKCAVR